MSGVHAEAMDLAQIRAVIDARVNAVQAKDAAGVLAHHALEFVHFSLAPPLIGAKPDSANLEAWFASWDGAITYRLRDLQIAASGDVAYCHGLAHLAGMLRGGTRSETWFRVTLGLRKRGGRWVVVHEHESVPFLMDGSYKAAVDLKP